MTQLADFGCSYLQGSGRYAKVHGVIPYMDPNNFNIQKSESQTYDLTEKSDIYSLGVLFWELTSCSSPFNFETENNSLIMLDIFEGKRENPVPSTNHKFVELYQSKYEIKILSYLFIIII